VIASHAVRAAPSRRVVRPRPRHTARLSRRAAGASWEMRTFVAISCAIAFVFLVAMLYLAETTTVATRGYEAQRLAQQRDELRRQNALLEVESARLDSPARIDAEAKRIGLVRVATVPVVQLEPITAKR
jgi:hypothetical protein